MFAKDNPEIPYRYYYDVFHSEFAATLKFGMPKTDCCNECSSFPLQKRDGFKANNIVLVQELEEAHLQHLTKANVRRIAMEVDFGAVDYVDVQLENITLEHDFDGQILEMFGPPSIFYHKFY